MSPESEEMNVKVGSDSLERSVSWIPGFLLQSEKGRSNSEARKPGKTHRLVDALFLDSRLLNSFGADAQLKWSEPDSAQAFAGWEVVVRWGER